MPNFGQTLLGMVPEAIGAGMGLLLEGHNDRRQLRQQEQLQRIQMQGMQEMGQFNFDQQMKLWEATNYGPQVEQMKKAGLNPALMYKGAGAGGVTQALGAPGVGGGNAPAGGMEIMNMMMQKAQIRLMEAQTNKTNAEAQNVPKTGENIEASTLDLLEGVENKRAIRKMTEIQTDILEIEKDIKTQTREAAINTIDQELDRIMNENEYMHRQNIISKATMENTIQKVQAELLAIGLHNELTRAQTDATRVGIAKTQAETQLTKQQIWALAERVSQDWHNTLVNEGQLGIDKMVNDVSNTVKMGIGVVQEIINVIFLKKLFGGSTSRPIRGFHNR